MDTRVETPRVSVTNYAELKRHYDDHLAGTGKSEQVRSNHRSALAGWMSAFALSDASAVGPELDGDFESHLARFKAALEGEGLGRSTRDSYSSHLRSAKRFYSAAAAAALPDEFHLALSALSARAGHTPSSLGRKVTAEVCDESTIRRWSSGAARPSVKSIPVIKRLEKLLHVPPGTLVSRLPKRLRGQGRVLRQRTTFGRKSKRATENTYTVWTPRLEAQWGKFVAFKTTPIKSEGVGRTKLWTSSEGAGFAAEGIARNYVKSFMGFCCLPKGDPDPYREGTVKPKEMGLAYMSGLGMRPGDMSLALLAVKKFVELYLEFQRVRAGGVYTDGTKGFIGSVMSMLRGGTGYLFQHPELAADLRGVIKDDGLGWQSRCLDTHARLGSIRADLEEAGVFVKGRDPDEPIRDILDQPRPLKVVLRMFRVMEGALPPPSYPAVTRAEFFRDLLLVMLLAANPLRVRQFSIMQFGRHLFRKQDGSWWLRFDRREFKNRGSLDSDYLVRVAPEVWPYIERYKEEYRPALLGAGECDYVFRPCARSKRPDTAPMTAEYLGQIVTKVTHEYIPGCPGFGPHGFRHIVATDIIKKNPSLGFFLASRALHDKLETVERAYAHLKTHEFFEPYNLHFAEVALEVREETL